jgi:hypothetical protein
MAARGWLPVRSRRNGRRRRRCCRCRRLNRHYRVERQNTLDLEGCGGRTVETGKKDEPPSSRQRPRTEEFRRTCLEEKMTA